MLLPVVAVLAARPDLSAVVLAAAGLSLGLRDAALRDLFVRTTTIGLFPPLPISSVLSPLLCSLSSPPAQPVVSQSAVAVLARSLARSSVREP